MSEKRASRWKQAPRHFKRKVLAVVGALSAIATGAFAAILISALIGGSMTVVSKPTAIWSSASVIPGVISTDGSGISCTPSVSNGKLNVNVTGAMPGSSCVVRAGGIYTDSAGLKVQGIEMSGLDVTMLASVMDGSTQQTGISCGSTLNTGTSNPNRAYLEIKVPENATTGTKPITGELTAVPQAQYDPALCSN